MTQGGKQLNANGEKKTELDGGEKKEPRQTCGHQGKGKGGKNVKWRPLKTDKKKPKCQGRVQTDRHKDWKDGLRGTSVPNHMFHKGGEGK